jgi:hypothetical protein
MQFKEHFQKQQLYNEPATAADISRIVYCVDEAEICKGVVKISS